MENKIGALPYQTILEMMKDSVVSGGLKENVNPSSLDVSINAKEVYRLERGFMPKRGEKIRTLLSYANASKHNTNNPLERDVIYIALLNEKLDLSKLSGVYGFCNPKSTTGRNDVHVRILADGVSRYDSIPKGYKGELWITIIPKSFSVKIPDKQQLAQIRFFNDDTRLNEKNIEKSFKEARFVWNKEGKSFKYGDLKIKDNDGSIILTLDLSDKIVGYESRGSNRVLDFSKIGFHNPEDFFDPIFKKNNFITLHRGCFYILSTYEHVLVPPEFACEMIPADERSGDFRAHYAGFIDPGWGYGKNGKGKGRPLTLEVRPFEDIIVRHGQPIAKIRFERVAGIPKVLYDSLGTSNYTVQGGAKLSKQFKKIK